ncbi:MAG: ABC transporter permease [Paludibacter sp.]|nr:ABC transporter permease [Paludibacter sp.]
MSVEYFLAKRINFQQGRKNVSRPAVRIAIIAIALGMAVMIIAIGVVIGFKQEVRNKVVGFGGHIRISNYDSNNTFETEPIMYDSSFFSAINKENGVQSVHRYATKPGIIKTDEDFQGIVLKGVDSTYDWSFFESGMIAGSVLNISDSLRNNIIISKDLAKLLKLKLGDSFFTYFIKEQVKARKFTISGIYSTNFAEFDKLFILTDIRHLQRLNGWEPNQFSGYEVTLTDFDMQEVVSDALQGVANAHMNGSNQLYFIQTIKDLYPQMFGWLELLDINVWVILALMLAVAGFNMISSLLILILERANMIGVLKSIGATNWTVRKVFLYYAMFLIGKGMLWGNIIGISLCVLQYFFRIVPLDAEAYYVAYVPVLFNWTAIAFLNIGVFFASVFMMIGPSYLISKISPAKIIRYE